MAEPSARTLDAPAAELGEGPVFEPESGLAWWFDIAGRVLYEHDLARGTTRLHPLPVIATALARVDGTRQLLAAEDGLYIRDVADGVLTLHRPLEADDPSTRSNDARVHPCGAFWIGTMGRAAEPQAGAIYWFFEGQLRRLYNRLTVPNAICFSPDGRVAYFADTPTGQILRVAVEPDTGLPAGEPVRFDEGGGLGGPDGAVVDGDGVLWVARWGGGCLEAYSPAGSLVRRLPLPVSQPTCPAFAGPRGASLLVTSAWEGLSDERRRAEPEAGRTFLLELDLRGRFEPAVRL
jgi:sugar lactone lactonase YvrE